MFARFFMQHDLPQSFYDDFMDIADDEARHFALLCERLQALGSDYGDLPAHDYLWKVALLYLSHVIDCTEC